MVEAEKTEVLLESGTNELEIMEFTIGGELFGINVAKVKEILRMAPIKPMQRSHPDVEGVFKPRDTVLTVINLSGYLKLPQSDTPNRDLFMVTHFNNENYAFHVHSVVGIDRISWTQMKKPDSAIYGGREGIATAIADYNGRLITILDFEAIIADISAEDGIQLSDLDGLGERVRSKKFILIAEDSKLLSKMIVESLHHAGYVNTVKKDNGKEAWDYLCELKNSDDIKSRIACIITDIEMPQMDGHRLTKLVKADEQLKAIPLILFSSLITDEMRIKGKQLGADEQITKPEIARLVTAIDKLTADD